MLGAIAMQDILDQVEELARVGCFDWQPETGRVAWSPGLHAIYGLEVGDFGGTVADFASYIHEDDRARVLQEIATGIEQEQYFRIGERICRADGSVRYLESSGRVVHRADGQPFRVVGACRDVTDRESYAKSLKWQVAGLELLAELAQERLAAASDVAKPAIADALLRRLARHLDCDHYYFHDAGSGRSSARDRLPDDEHPAGSEEQLHLDAWSRELITKSYADDATSDELPQVWRRAGVRAAHWTLLGNQGQALGAIAFGTSRQDRLSSSQIKFVHTLGRLVTALLLRARSRRELEAQEERFRTLFDCAGEAIFLVAQDGRIMDANREACAPLGYSRAELLSMHVRDIQASEPDMMPVLREAATGG
ncbi:MAG TPA: PAS domain S-box protein, partial [Planctomycetota bacterium]|nr:PAS domain S-box protein [Planctomycetota bacterium]